MIGAVGVAPGRATGPAAVLTGAESDLDRVVPGAILVAKILHPHQAPLMLLAAGLVVEEASVLQHATTLAREFRVPGIVNARGATMAILDGQRLTIDGDTGRVSVLGHERC